MLSRRQLAVGAAGLAVLIGVPMGLTSGGGSVDVFVGSTPTPTATPTGTPTATPTATPFTTANEWVDSNGGTCTRQGTAGAYSDAGACGTVDAAWDASTAGDRICIKAGTYGTQVVSGNKASETTITGNCGGAVTIGPGSGTVTCTGVSGPGSDATFCPDGNNMTLDTVTINTGTANRDLASIARINSSNVTFRNVNGNGNYPQLYVTASNFVWNGGSLGDASPPHLRDCLVPGQPIQIDSGSLTLKGMRFYPVLVDESSTGGLCDSGGPHPEYLRIQCNCSVVFRDNLIDDGGEAGSGVLFTGITQLDNLKVIGNYFGDQTVDNYMQAGNLTSCSGWLWAYNTFSDSAMGFNIPGACAGITSVGNLGINPPGDCANHIKNVTFGSGSCGTDTRIGAASLNLDSVFCPNSGSPAVNSGETAPGTYAQGSDVGGTDRLGHTRGADGTNDAGSCER